MPAAAIEDEYHYERCCPDEEGKCEFSQLWTVTNIFSGLHSPDWNVSDPTTCSIRQCKTQEGWAQAAWVTSQQYPGCGCCVVEGKLVPDGFSWTIGSYPVQTWECCRGKIVRVTDLTQQPSTKTTATTETTIMTTHTTTTSTTTSTTTAASTIGCRVVYG